MTARIHRLSASSLGRARSCLYWARPDVPWSDSPPGTDAVVGTAVHKCAELATDGQFVDPLRIAEDAGLDDVAQGRVDRMFERWADWWKMYSKRADSWATEQPIAWNVRTRTARRLKKGDHRAYVGLDPYEIPGTTDVVGETANRVEAIDLKTGRIPVEHPKTNPQTLLLDMAESQLTGKPAMATIAAISEEAVVATPHPHDDFDHAAFADEVEDMVARTPKAEPVPGPWCKWCKARAHCTETGVVVDQILTAASIVRRPSVSLEIQSAEHAAGMLTAIDAADAFLVELRKRLEDYARTNGGIPMPDGTVWAAHPYSVERADLSTPEAVAALRELGLDEAIKTSVSTTWAAIKRVAGKPGEDKAREALRALGAVKVGEYEKFEARAPKKKGRAA